MNQVASTNGQTAQPLKNVCEKKKKRKMCVCVYDLNQVVLVTFIIAKILETQMSINRGMDRKTGIFIQ